MKRNLTIAVLLISCLTSCLKEKMDSFDNAESFYKTVIQCRAITNGCYMGLHNIYGQIGFFFSLEATTDLMYAKLSQADAQLDISPSYCGIATTVWNESYTGIMRCNEVIWGIDNICQLADSVKNVYSAEARVLRAMYYYVLTNTFNGVPFYTRRVDSKETMDYIRHLGRTDASEIRQAMYEDLRDNALPWFTKENGLKARTYEVEGNRAGYAMALMLMGKFAMWNQDWEGALNALDELETLYGELNEDNYPLDDIRWSLKNVKESIFEVQNDYDVAGVQYFGKIAYVAQPDHNGNGIYDGVYMPDLGTTVITGHGLQCTQYYAGFRPATGQTKTETSDKTWKYGLLNPLPLTYGEYSSSLNRYTAVLDLDAIRIGEIRGQKIDRRVVYKMGMGDLKTGDTFTYVKNNGRPWAGPEFWRYNQVSNCDGNNYHILRYADAVLMQAECHARLGNLETAQKYLNYTRSRAGVDPLSYSSSDDLVANIIDERARELGGEFHRKWDLVRWGIWYSRTTEWNLFSDVQYNIRPYHEYYPIPDVECSMSGYILKNEAYSQN